jgi:hypothetical protein
MACASAGLIPKKSASKALGSSSICALVSGSSLLTVRRELNSHKVRMQHVAVAMVRMIRVVEASCAEAAVRDLAAHIPWVEEKIPELVTSSH